MSAPAKPRRTSDKGIAYHPYKAGSVKPGHPVAPCTCGAAWGAAVHR